MGVPGPKPVPVFGNFIQEMKTGLGNYHKKAYLDYKRQGHKVITIISSYFLNIQYSFYSSKVN